MILSGGVLKRGVIKICGPRTFEIGFLLVCISSIYADIISHFTFLVCSWERQKLHLYYSAWRFLLSKTLDQRISNENLTRLLVRLLLSEKNVQAHQRCLGAYLAPMKILKQWRNLLLNLLGMPHFQVTHAINFFVWQRNLFCLLHIAQEC